MASLFKLRAQQLRQDDVRMTLDVYHRDIQAFKQAEIDASQTLEEIDDINRRLEKKNISNTSEADASQQIEAMSEKTDEELEEKEGLKRLWPKKNLLAARYEGIKESIKDDGLLNFKKIEAEKMLGIFEAGKKGDFGEELKNSINTTILELAEEADPDVVLFTSDITQIDLPVLLETYQHAALKFRDSETKDKNQKRYFAALMGVLDEAITKKWRAEVLSSLQGQLEDIKGFSKSSHAIEFMPSSIEFMRFHDDTYERRRNTATNNLIQLMAIAQVHGNPGFMTKQVGFLSQQELPSEAQDFFKKVMVFDAFHILDSTREEMSRIDMGAPEEEYRKAQRELIDSYKPFEPLASEMDALKDQRDEKKSALERKYSRIEERNRPIKQVLSHPNVSSSSLLPEAAEHKTVSTSFGLASATRLLKDGSVPCLYTVRSQENATEEQPPTERRPSIFRSLIPPSLRKPSDVLVTSFLIGKAKSGNSELYMTYIPTYGYGTFDDLASLQKFLTKSLEYMAKQNKQKAPEHFQVREINVNALQRVADAQSSVYNRPYIDKPVSTWDVSFLAEKHTARALWNTTNYDHNFIVALEGDRESLKAAMDLYNKHPQHSTLILWNPNSNESRTLFGKDRPFDSKSRLHLVGLERSQSVPSVVSPAQQFETWQEKVRGESASAPAPDTSAPAKSTSQISLNTVDSAEKERNPVRTLANQSATELVPRVVNFIEHRNKELNVVGATLEQQIPEQFNIVNFHPVVGIDAMKPYAASFTEGLYNGYGIERRVSTIEVPHTTNAGHKVIIDNKKNNKSASEHKAIYEFNGKGEHVTKEYVITDINEVQGWIKLKPQNSERPNPPETVINVGDNVSRYKKWEKVIVKHTKTHVEVEQPNFMTVQKKAVGKKHTQ